MSKSTKIKRHIETPGFYVEDPDGNIFTNFMASTPSNDS